MIATRERLHLTELIERAYLAVERKGDLMFLTGNRMLQQLKLSALRARTDSVFGFIIGRLSLATSDQDFL